MNSNQAAVSTADELSSGAVSHPLTFMRIDRLESDTPFLNGGVDSAAHEVTVNGSTISTEEILAEAQHHPADTANDAIEAATRALIVKELLIQQAVELDIVPSPASDGSNTRETTEDTLISALIESEVDIPTATESTCERYYRLHPERFTSETLYEVQHILLSTAEDDKRGREAIASETKDMIAYLADHPEDFSLLAESRSDCPSREHNGNLGQIGQGSTVPEFESALVSLPVGTIAPAAIESRYGFHIVFVKRVIPGEPLPFEAVSQRIGAWLEASSWSRAMSQYISILAGRADIQGFDINGSDSPLVQ